MITSAQTPVFQYTLQNEVCPLGNSASALNATAFVSDGGTLTYQWQRSTDGTIWADIQGEASPVFTPPTTVVGKTYYRCTVLNTNGYPNGLTPSLTLYPAADLYPVQIGVIYTASSVSNSAEIQVVGASTPAFAHVLVDALYAVNSAAVALDGTATALYGTILYQWQKSSDGSAWANVSGQTGASFTPPTDTLGTVLYRVHAVNTVGTSTAENYSNVATIITAEAVAPAFSAALISAEYDVGDTVSPLNGSATAPYGTISYQWYRDGVAILGADSATYTPLSNAACSNSYFCRAINTVGTSTASADSNTVTVAVYAATAPKFTVQPESVSYIENDQASALESSATSPRGTIAYQWQSSQNASTWFDISDATSTSLQLQTTTVGTFYYRLKATNTVGTSSAESHSDTAVVTVVAAQRPIFDHALMSANYLYAHVAKSLDGTASVTDGGTISYQWFSSTDGSNFVAIIGAAGATYRPSSMSIGTFYYYCIATNQLHNSSRSNQSNTAAIIITDTRLSKNEQWLLYLRTLKTDFLKLCRLDFLQPDGSVAFSIDNNPRNPRSSAFIQDGTLDVNLQNGQRRKASVTLSNLDSAYDFQINKIWYGQQIRLMEGLMLPNGDEYYIPQGVFYVSDPEETFSPGKRIVTYELLDKAAYLDGTLFGNLDGIYEVPVGTNVLTAISSILAFDRGNGYQIDSSTPIFSSYWNEKTVTLTDGTTQSILLSPYTYRCDSDSGTYWDVISEMNTMLVGWIGYDPTGRLRMDAGDDDILDTSKPVLWDFTPTEREFLGATYRPKISEVFNDVIVEGQTLDDNSIARGRATNMDARSDSNIYSSLGKRTKRLSMSTYRSNQQCEDYAAYYLKRNTILKKSVTIRASQIFHIQENNLVTILRMDKPGQPVERHLVTGFSRPLSQQGEMTITATSVQDFPEATITPLPGA